jgi:hypothetical protein
MHFAYSVCNGKANAAVQVCWHDFHNKKSQTDMFNTIHEQLHESGSYVNVLFAELSM